MFTHGGVTLISMARMPGAEWVGEHGSTLMTEASLNKVCVHTIVGNPPAHAAHFSVRADGHIYQSRDTRFRSAANYYGNDDVIAIENDDHGPEFGTWNVNDGHAVPGFTAAQIEANARIIAWANKVHGIPIVRCPDSKDASQGVAYHRQGIDGNFLAEGYAYGGRVAGGEVWSTSRGKVCPGDRRIKQLIERIIPRARVLAGLEEDDDMPTLKELLDTKVGDDGLTAFDDWADKPGTWGHFFRFMRQNSWATRQLVTAQGAALDKLADLLAAGSSDLTAAEVKAAVKSGVTEALAESTVNVDIDVTGPSTA